MHENNEYFQNILIENGGFNDPSNWIKFARKHNFKKVKSQKRHRCPSCGNKKVCTFAQYIYYSNLFFIKYCRNCGLYFSDTLLSHEIVKHHFENAYKDDFYFKEQRKHIFKYISRLASRYTPLNGKVIDIGGGKGHLLDMFRKMRPDTVAKLNDISKDSCKFCSENFKIDSICCGISDLVRIEDKFDTILLIDVIYYEPSLNRMFDVVNNILNSDRGTLIIRIPNKIKLIKLFQLKLKLFRSHDKIFFQNNVKFFNPEHIYIFSRRYLNNKLRKLGLKNIKFIPSPLLCKGQGKNDANMKRLFKIAMFLNRLSFGKLLLTPSMIIIAKRS